MFIMDLLNFYKTFRGVHVVKTVSSRFPAFLF